MSCTTTFNSHYNECPLVHDDKAGKRTQLCSLEVVVGGPVIGPCPVGVTPLGLSVRSVNSCTVKPERKGHKS